MSNLETLLTAWLTDGEVPEDFEPETRIEEYLVAILNGVDDSVTPESRADVLLDAIATKYAGYSDGIDDLRDKLGLSNYSPFDDATTPKKIANVVNFLNGVALQDLAAKGVTGVDRNTIDILNAIQDIPQGGAELNIAYGNTAPEDTTKLWVKTAEPTNVTADYDINNGVESVQLLTSTLPTAAGRISCGAVGSKIYLFGGNTGSYTLSTINVFDTETNIITNTGVTLPTFLQDAACGVVGKKIYLFGGDTGSYALDTINVFDTETNSVTTLTARLPVATNVASCGVVGTKIYLFGGENVNKKINTINVFDTTTNTISTLSTTLPVGTSWMSCGVVGTKIYLFGGSTSNGNTNTIKEFDTVTNTITTLAATLPKAVASLGTWVVGKKIYIPGLTNSMLFDAGTGITETISLHLTAVSWGNCYSCAVVGSNGYCFGGYKTNDGENAINKFTITFPLNEGDVYLQSDVFKNKFTLVTAPTEVKTGVSAVYVGNASNEAEYAEAYLHDGTQWRQI